MDADALPCDLAVMIRKPCAEVGITYYSMFEMTDVPSNTHTCVLSALPYAHYFFPKWTKRQKRRGKANKLPGSVCHHCHSILRAYAEANRLAVEDTEPPEEWTPCVSFACSARSSSLSFPLILLVPTWPPGMTHARTRATAWRPTANATKTMLTVDVTAIVQNDVCTEFSSDERTEDTALSPWLTNLVRCTLGKRRWPGCTCSKSKKRNLCRTNDCQCWRAHRECDPELCTRCGAK